jgi:hypothetical protein
MSLTNSGAFENSRNPLKIIVAPGETLVCGHRDVALPQDVGWDRSSQRNKLGALAHGHSDCDRGRGAYSENSFGLRFIRGEYPANQWNHLFVDFGLLHNIVKQTS